MWVPRWRRRTGSPPAARHPGGDDVPASAESALRWRAAAGPGTRKADLHLLAAVAVGSRRFPWAGTARDRVNRPYRTRRVRYRR